VHRVRPLRLVRRYRCRRHLLRLLLRNVAKIHWHLVVRLCVLLNQLRLHDGHRNGHRGRVAVVRHLRRVLLLDLQHALLFQQHLLVRLQKLQSCGWAERRNINTIQRQILELGTQKIHRVLIVWMGVSWIFPVAITTSVWLKSLFAIMHWGCTR
jgi:hypothetical protein